MNNSKSVKVVFLSVLFFMVFICGIGSTQIVNATIIFDGYHVPIVNNGELEAVAENVTDNDNFTNHGLLPNTIVSNTSATSRVVASSQFAYADGHATVKVDPTMPLSSIPVELGEYSFSIYSASYDAYSGAIVSTDLPFRFSGSGEVYWGVKWALQLGDWPYNDGGAYGRFSLLDKPGLDESYSTYGFPVEVSGTAFGSYTINGSEDFNFSTYFRSGYNGMANGDLKFAFSTDPFDRFPSVPEPSTILFLGSGLIGFFGIRKNK